MPKRSADMPFLEHLDELRRCLGSTMAGMLVMSILCFVWAGSLFEALTEPLRIAFTNAQLIGTGPAEAFMVKLKVAIAAGIVTSSPFTFLQLWRFISPGLHEKEQRTALPFVFFSTFFFLIGFSFCFYVVFPIAFEFFYAEFRSINIVPTIKIGEYLSFAIKMLLVFGIIFELPVLSYFLARLGLLSHTWLIEKGRYSIVIIFIVAAILTPPDIATQLLLAGPLLVIYCMCIGIAYLANPDKKRNQDPAQSKSG